MIHDAKAGTYVHVYVLRYPLILQPGVLGQEEGVGGTERFRDFGTGWLSVWIMPDDCCPGDRSHA